MDKIDKYRLQDLPDAIYIPNFIDTDQERYILDQIHRLPASRWTVLSHRRLLSMPSQLTGTARDTMLDAPMPNFLNKNIMSRITELAVFKDSPHGRPNHCLVNEYEAGQGISPHEDGPAYYPITATISLASHTVLEIYGKNEDGAREVQPGYRILQEPRSLLLTTGSMYKDTLHGISEYTEDTDLNADNISNWNLLGDRSVFETGTAQRETRVSLTYRDVLKVAKVGGALKFMNKR